MQQQGWRCHATAQSRHQRLPPCAATHGFMMVNQVHDGWTASWWRMMNGTGWLYRVLNHHRLQFRKWRKTWSFSFKGRSRVFIRQSSPQFWQPYWKWRTQMKWIARMRKWSQKYDGTPVAHPNMNATSGWYKKFRCCVVNWSRCGKCQNHSKQQVEPEQCL